MLGSPPLRTALNAAYERGPLLAAPVTRFFSGSTVTAPFVWRARLPAGVLLVPVVPELQRSWTNALVWRWPPNLPMRRLYETYTLCRDGGGVLLDVGANDGLHSCLFSLAGWRCIAFEPQTGCVAYLRRIAALNGFGKLAVEQCAVGDRQASAVDFYVSGSGWFSSLDRGHVERYEAAERISVEIVTLDAYCREHGVAPTCIKIDVEGHELHVLRGASAVLGQARPDLVVEVSANSAIREAIWELLAPLGYRGYVVAREGLRAIPTQETFRAAGPGDYHIDAVFTADQTLGEQLGARLAGR
jgi:FkbM family methyltransferase